MLHKNKCCAASWVKASGKGKVRCPENNSIAGDVIGGGTAAAGVLNAVVPQMRENHPQASADTSNKTMRRTQAECANETQHPRSGSRSEPLSMPTLPRVGL